jgi:C1A family cysteine protease
VRPRGFARVQMNNESALREAVWRGPVAVSVDASLPSFQYYSSGIYSDPECVEANINHAVLLVGYGTDNRTKKDYWLVKNAWSAEWGEVNTVYKPKGLYFVYLFFFSFTSFLFNIINLLITI